MPSVEKTDTIRQVGAEASARAPWNSALEDVCSGSLYFFSPVSDSLLPLTGPHFPSGKPFGAVLVSQLYRGRGRMCGPGFVSGRRSVAKGRAEGAGRNSIFPVTVLRIAVYPVCWFASDKVL